MLRLKELRKQHKLSQKDFAGYMDVAQNTVSNWENENRDIDSKTLTKIAEFFHVSTDYLLGKSDMPSPALSIPEELKDVRVAFHRGEFEDLTQEEVDALAVIAKTLKAQRKGGMQT